MSSLFNKPSGSPPATIHAKDYASRDGVDVLTALNAFKQSVKILKPAEGQQIQGSNVVFVRTTQNLAATDWVLYTVDIGPIEFVIDFNSKSYDTAVTEYYIAPGVGLTYLSFNVGSAKDAGVTVPVKFDPYLDGSATVKIDGSNLEIVYDFTFLGTPYKDVRVIASI